jgi:hypothetical protein
MPRSPISVSSPAGSSSRSLDKQQTRTTCAIGGATISQHLRDSKTCARIYLIVSVLIKRIPKQYVVAQRRILDPCLQTTSTRLEATHHTRKKEATTAQTCVTGSVQQCRDMKRSYLLCHVRKRSSSCQLTSHDFHLVEHYNRQCNHTCTVSVLVSHAQAI